MGLRPSGRDLLGGIATFGASSETPVACSGSTNTTTSLAYLVGATTTTHAAMLFSIDVSWAGGAGGNPCTLMVRYISALNGTEGGTANTVVGSRLPDTAGADAAIRMVSGANAPTRASGNWDMGIISVANPGSYHFDCMAVHDGMPPLIRAGKLDGWEVSVKTDATTAPTTAASFVVNMKWMQTL